MRNEAADTLDAVVGAAVGRVSDRVSPGLGRARKARSNSQAGVAQWQSNCFVNSRSGVRIPAPAPAGKLDLSSSDFVHK
jgi:hypothetical protein